MISKKIFQADGTNNRFLSDFIIRSEQFTRVYNYVYDPNGIDGEVDPNSGLFIRITNSPSSADIVTIDKWDLVDNSISFYTAPYVGSMIYIEVASTPEEFGDTLVQPSIEKAEAAAISATASAAEAAVSESNAATSEANASASELSASISASNASSSASDASASEVAAATSETNANASALSASTSASNASISAVASSTSEANALTSENNAKASELAAGVSETNADLSRIAAATSEANSSASETLAYKWAENPEDSEVSVGEYSAKHWAIKAINAGISVPTFPADEGRIWTASANGSKWGSVVVGQNILINPDLIINQRGITTLPASGQYWYDRWRSTGTGMVQVVEEGNYVPNAVYTYSGDGITTHQITAPASGHWVTSEVPSTARKLKLELGTEATPFEPRTIAEEYLLCYRYYEYVSVAYGATYLQNGTKAFCSSEFKATKRVNPSLNYSVSGYARTYITNYTNIFSVNVYYTLGTSGYVLLSNIKADSEIY